jgi:hypothetical protein
MKEPAREAKKSDAEMVFGTPEERQSVFKIGRHHATRRSTRRSVHHHRFLKQQYTDDNGQPEDDSEVTSPVDEIEETQIERIVDLLIVTGRMEAVGGFADYLEIDKQSGIFGVLCRRVAFELETLILDTPAAKAREGYEDQQTAAAWLIGLRSVLEFEEYITGIDKDLAIVKQSSVVTNVEMAAQVNEFVAKQLATYRDDPDFIDGPEPYVASRQFCAVVQKQLGEDRFAKVEELALKLWLSALEEASSVSESEFRNLQSLASMRSVKLDPDRIRMIEERLSTAHKETISYLYAQLKVAVLANNSDKIMDLSEQLLAHGQPEDEVMETVRALDFRKANQYDDESDDEAKRKIKAGPKKKGKAMKKVVNAVRAMSILRKPPLG